MHTRRCDELVVVRDRWVVDKRVGNHLDVGDPTVNGVREAAYVQMNHSKDTERHNESTK